MKNPIKNHSGFTFVEILISTAILCGLAYVAMNTFKGTKSVSKTTELKSSSLNTAIELAIKTAQTPELFFNFSSSSAKLFEVRCYSTSGIQLGESNYSSGKFATIGSECMKPGTKDKIDNLMFVLHQRWVDASNIEMKLFIFDKAKDQHSITTKEFKIVAKNAL